MSSTVFGVMPDATPVPIWTIENGTGTRVRCLAYGAALVSVEVPDRQGRLADVALGFDSLDAYLTHRGCLGAVVGRYANRIRDGRFPLDGRTVQLSTRPDGLHIHGGRRGFDKVLWTGEAFADGRGVRFSYVSPDGEEGYPGTCQVSVCYALTDDHELVVDYAAVTDAPTPINLSQHSYFNLGGHAAGSVLDHEMTIWASQVTAVDASLIPTGAVLPVDGTPLDFRAPHRIGDRIEDAHEQLRLAGGYDHNFILDAPGAGTVASGLRRAARAVDPRSGRTLDVYTTEPAVQFYTGNSLDGSQVGKGGIAYTRRSGFCLETQHYPNSPNIPAFPTTILRPGGEFRSRTVFAFGCA